MTWALSPHLSDETIIKMPSEQERERKGLFPRFKEIYFSWLVQMCGLFIKRYVAVVLTMQLKLCNPRRIILERRDSAGGRTSACLYGPELQRASPRFKRQTEPEKNPQHLSAWKWHISRFQIPALLTRTSLPSPCSLCLLFSLTRALQLAFSSH